MIANNIFFLAHYSLVKIYLLYPDLYRKSNMEKSNGNESVALVSISPTSIKLLLPKEVKSNVSHILEHVNLHLHPSFCK